MSISAMNENDRKSNVLMAQTPSVVPIMKIVASVRTTPVRARPADASIMMRMPTKSTAPTTPATKSTSSQRLCAERCAAWGISLVP